jgi:hypothetical protein
VPERTVLFRYGIEHECALLRPDGTFADFTNTTFDELQDIVDVLPEDPADLADLRVGDVGIKLKRWYVEGYERFDEHGSLLRCDPKGLEIRTRIHPSIEAATAALCADQRLLDAAAAARGLGVIAIGFNPVRSEYVVEPAFNVWERVHRLVSDGPRVARWVMPDLAGRTLQDAQEWITLCGFRGGAVRRVPADGRRSGTIVGQLPLSGYPIARRDVVELTVAD